MVLRQLFGRWLRGRRARRPARRRGGGEPFWWYPDPFTGEPVLPPDDTDAARLEAAGLPVLRNLAELARAVGLPWGELLWLANPSSRYPLTDPHYRLLLRRKPDGRLRLILAPRPRLKAVQRWILRHILAPLPPHPAAHAFCRGRSTATHAALHTGREIVVRMDLEDFFHAVTYRRVRGLFRSLGYSTEVSVLLALLTTFRPETFPYEHRRHLPPPVWLAAVGSRRSYRGYPTQPPFLPQGAPTSPALANLVARRLDRRLAGLARAFGAVYSRYADDLTFSGDGAFRRDLARFFRAADRILREEGFREARAKRRIHRRGGRQLVTGLVVNRRPNLPRPLYRRLRAMLHRARTAGPHAVQWPGTGSPRAYLAGWIAHLNAVDPDRAARLRAQFLAVRWER